MTILALLALLAWGYLAAFRGGFWRADQRLGPAPAPDVWPSVAAVIPARNEAATIAEVISAHLAADYAGDFTIILVDDNSTDETANAARGAAEGSEQFQIIEGAPLAKGWTGKLWAVEQGLQAAREAEPAYVLLTDADIVLAPNTLSRLVAKAENERLSLVSLMARLDARGVWGGLLIPAFVFFFQKLYPFPLSNDADDPVAAAAGGCMLVRTSDLEAAGGVRSIRNALIDDCALAGAIKNASPAARIWLGLSDTEAVSQRDNRSLSAIWTMVARTAYAQLAFSPALVVGAVLGMALLYLAAPFIALSLAWHDNFTAAFLALAAWGVMARLYWPTLKLYGGATWQAATLPIAAALYTAMTIDSARRHHQGRGGQWKNRHYDFGKTP